MKYKEQSLDFMFFSTVQCVMCAPHYDMWCVPFNGVQLQMCLVGMRVLKKKERLSLGIWPICHCRQALLGLFAWLGYVCLNMAGTECVWQECTRWKLQEERLRAGQGVLLEGCFCMCVPYA